MLFGGLEKKKLSMYIFDVGNWFVVSYIDI